MLLGRRLLAENNISRALVQALQRTVGRYDSSPAAAGDFSIAAVQSATANSTTQSLQTDLPASLLQALLAFSISRHLSEQLLSAEVLEPIAVVLNKGSVHDSHTSLAVELLWNLLETCPLSNPTRLADSTSPNSFLAARHSQILKPRQLKEATASTSKLKDTAQDGSDAEQASAVQPDSEPATEVDIELAQGSDQDSRNTMHRKDMTEEDAAPVGVKSAQGQQPTATDDSIAAADHAADTIEEPGSPAQKSEAEDEGETVAHAADEETAAKVDVTDTDLSASCLSISNSQLGIEAAALGSEVDDSAMTDAEETAASESSHTASIEGCIAAGIVTVLADCLENGYSTADKELRNTVLVVAGMLAESRQYRRLLCCSDMLHQLLLASTEPELGDSSTAFLKVRCSWLRCTNLPCCAVLCF